MRIFDPTLTTLERSLDVRLARHGVLAGNVANANTPGFVPRDVDFAAAMRDGIAPSSAPAPNDAPIPVPRASMTLASAGHRVETSNDIPLDVAGTPGAAVPGAPTPTVTAMTSGAGLDGNAVDVDRALAAVAENAIQYGAAARAAQKKLAILRYAASDGAA
jgi:flagellar basal-body rod protein FlgB